MTTSTTVTKASGLTVINLKVTKEGNIERKMTDVSPQAQLNNTLLEALCPGIRVASVTVTPEPLDSSRTRQSGKRSFAVQRRRHRLPAPEFRCFWMGQKKRKSTTRWMLVLNVLSPLALLRDGRKLYYDVLRNSGLSLRR